MKASLKSYDWCHICGVRSEPCVDVWYPENSEHPRTNPPEDKKYVRICKACLVLLTDIAEGRIKHVGFDKPQGTS